MCFFFFFLPRALGLFCDDDGKFIKGGLFNKDLNQKDYLYYTYLFCSPLGKPIGPKDFKAVPRGGRMRSCCWRDGGPGEGQAKDGQVPAASRYGAVSGVCLSSGTPDEGIKWVKKNPTNQWWWEVTELLHQQWKNISVCLVSRSFPPVVFHRWTALVEGALAVKGPGSANLMHGVFLWGITRPGKGQLTRCSSETYWITAKYIKSQVTLGSKPWYRAGRGGAVAGELPAACWSCIYGTPSPSYAQPSSRDRG